MSPATNQRWLNINRRSVLLPIISLLTNGEPGGRSRPGWGPRGGRSSSVTQTNEQNGMVLAKAGRRQPAQGGASPWLTFLSASVRTRETFVQLSIKVTWAWEQRRRRLLLHWLRSELGGGGGGGGKVKRMEGAVRLEAGQRSPSESRPPTAPCSATAQERSLIRGPLSP